MEDLFQLEQNGQGVQKDDMNLVAMEAAKSQDWLLSELLRPAPTGAADGFAPLKYIIPSGGALAGGYSHFDRKPLIGTSGAANSTIKIQPFTALVGSLENQASGTKEALREIRTARHYGQVDNAFQTSLQLPAATLHRWDLIYAKVDVDTADPDVTRYVKQGDAAVTAVSVSVRTKCSLTIGFVSGAEGGAPVRPTLPSDGSGSYYILLGYVYVLDGHTLVTQIPATQIHEAYQTIPLSAAFGVSRIQPADSCFRVDGASAVNEGWGHPYHKPHTHQPAGMVGGEERHIPLAMTGTHISVLANTSTLIDRSCDWRKRRFKSVIHVVAPSNDSFPWADNNPPAANLGTWAYHADPPLLQVGQSFINDATSNWPAITGGVVVVLATLSQYGGLAAGAVCVIYVGNDGFLYCYRNAVDPGKNAVIWLEATAPYRNTDANGT